MTATTGEVPTATADRPTVRTAMIMGLPFSIHLRGAPDPRVVDEAVARVWSTLRWAEQVFSTYRADSDITRIGTGQLRLPDADPAVREVLDFAEIARRLTDGAFDVNGPTGLDPSGVVKGWAATLAAAPLRHLEVDFTLNAGGDVLAHAEGERGWRIGIEHPDDPQGLLGVVGLHRGAVATSGGSHRGAHIWDPHTAAPATGIAQATVIGPSLLWADVLATAVVAGGLSRLDHHQWPPGHEVLLVTDDGTLLGSPGFARNLVDDVPAPPISPLY